MTCANTPIGRRREGLAGVEDVAGFDALIDARSPGEFAEDHLPGAINLPVLDDLERARVGTLHKQDSAFAAKKVGAALVSRNIANHLETHFAGQPRDYRPLVYCWRGGNRSGAFVTVLRAIGWHAAQLEGGYKSFRRHVINELGRLPATFRWRVICGPTGVGKSRLLRALTRNGAQVLDLEDLAAHMGSVLGAYPDRSQPSQKLFESRIWEQLRRFDPARPVFVESESRKIGRLQTPGALLQTMRAAPCIRIEAETAIRVALLQDEYAHFLTDAESLSRQLDCLKELQGHERIEAWKVMARNGHWEQLVSELLTHHYDPAYGRSLERNFPQAAQGPVLTLTSVTDSALLGFAQEIIDKIS